MVRRKDTGCKAYCKGSHSPSKRPPYRWNIRDEERRQDGRKWSKHYRQASEEVFNGVFGDIVGQVAQEGRVGGAAGEARAVHVGLAGRPRCRGQDGAVDGRRPVHVLLRVPGSGDLRKRKRRRDEVVRVCGGRVCVCVCT